MSAIIDISRPIDDSLAVWRGQSPPRLDWLSSIGKGDARNATQLCMNVHSGTHADAPLHFFAEARSLAEIPLEVFIGECVVADISGRVPCEMDAELARSYRGVKRLLVKSLHSLARGGTTYNAHGRLLTLEAAGILIERGLLLLGTDRQSPDDSEGRDFALHHVLLGAGCVIVEGLSLALAEPKRYMLLSQPLNLGRREAGPVRALLLPLEEGRKGCERTWRKADD